MKVKLKNKNSNLPNCWKQCGAIFEDWQKLGSGETIDAQSIPGAVEDLLEEVATSSKKGD